MAGMKYIAVSLGALLLSMPAWAATCRFNPEWRRPALSSLGAPHFSRIELACTLWENRDERTSGAC